MTTLSSAKTILEADTATLVATATGGIYDYDETGRMGINRTNTPSAFTNGIIKPCLLLKLRSSVPWGDIVDPASKTVSLREMFEVWFYQDNGFTTIETMRARVFALLHEVQLSGTFVCRWAQDVYPPRDMEMDANVLRSDFAVVLKRN